MMLAKASLSVMVLNVLSLIKGSVPPSIQQLPSDRVCMELDSEGECALFAPCIRQLQPKKHHEQWATFANNEEWNPVPIEVFSAHWDDRNETLHLHESGHIIVVAHGLQHEYNQVPSVFCHVTYDHLNWVYTGTAQYVRLYNSRAHHDEYVAHYLLCKSDNDDQDIPVSVGLSTKVCPEHVTDLVALSVLAPAESRPQWDLSVCLSPLHNNAQPTQLAEFIEYYRLQGVQHFTVYSHQSLNNIRTLRLAEYYASQGVLQVVNWPLPESHNYFYFDQRSALNDCLLRNRARYFYTGFLDLDEFILPSAERTLPVVLADLSSSHPKTASYCFQHVFMHPDYDADSKDQHLVTQRRLRRASVIYPAREIRSKCIHVNQRLFATDIHDSLFLMRADYEKLFIREEDGVLLHYRPSWMQIFDKKSEITFDRDESMLRFATNLSHAVMHVLDQTGNS